MTALENRKREAEIAKFIVETTELNKELKWYEVTVIVAAILATFAVAKLFL